MNPIKSIKLTLRRRVSIDFYRLTDKVPWVPEVFLACGGKFRAGHYKDLTETGNRARKVSGTQGTDKVDIV